MSHMTQREENAEEIWKRIDQLHDVLNELNELVPMSQTDRKAHVLKLMGCVLGPLAGLRYTLPARRIIQ